MAVTRMIWPRSRWKRVAVIAAATLVVYTLAGFFLLPLVIEHYTVTTLSEQLDRETGIKQVRFNPYTFACEIKGLTIEKKSGGGNWLAVDSLLVNLQASSAYRRALILSRLRVDHPSISMTRHSDGSYNFSDLLVGEGDADSADTDDAPFRYSVNNIEIISGEVEFEDRPAQTRHNLSGLSFSLPTLSNFPYAVETFVEPSISGRINEMSFDLDGRTKPFARSRQSRFDVVVDDLELAHYLSYLPGDRNFSLDGGRMSTDLQLTYAHPEQEVPHLKLEGSAELNDLRMLLGKDRGHEFCTIPRLRLELDGGNLLSGGVSLAKFLIQEPRVRLIRRDNGTFFLPELNTASSANSKEDPSSSEPGRSNPFSLALDQLQLEGGSVSFVDRSTSPEFSTTLHPVRLSLEELRTDSEDPSVFRMEMRTDKEEVLAVNGSLVLTPLQLQAETRLSGILLERFSPYYDPYFQGTVNEGSCDLGLNISLQGGETTEMRFTGLHLDLEDLSVSDAQGRRVVSLPEFSLREGRFLPSEREIAVGSVSLKNSDFRIKRQANGRLNVSEMALSESASSSEENSTSGSKPWRFVLNELSLDGSKAVYTDETLPSEVQISVSDISFLLKDFSTEKQDQATLEASLRIEDKGRLDVQGAFSMIPMSANMDVGLQNLALRPLEPIVRQYVDIVLNRGFLDVQGTLEMKGREGTGDSAVSFQGDTSIRDVSASDPDKKIDLFAWDDLSLSNIHFTSRPSSLRIGEINFAGLDTQMVISEDGRSNIPQAAQGDSSAERGDETPQKGDSRTDIAIDAFHLTRGSLTFVDNSISPPFQSSLSDLQLNIKNLSNRKEEPADISVQANLGSNAPLRMEGRIDFLGEKFFTDVDVDLANISLSPFSPYSGRYIGFAISKGKFYLDSSVRVDGSALDTKNSLLLDQFTLGEKVDSPQAVNAPVKLGIALLKNREGKIHIDKAVKGDLSDPEFTIGDLIMRVFVNVVIKAAKSPFALLGSMFGGGEDMNQAVFSPGEAELDQETKDKLSKLAQALYERPGLQVDIMGRADTVQDKTALHEDRFRRLLRQQKYSDMSEEKRAEMRIEDVRVTQEEYADYLWQAYKNASMEKPKNVLGGTKKIPQEEMEQRIRSNISITKKELKDIAAKRARNVMNYLQEKGPVEPERIFWQVPKIGTGQNHAFRKVEVRIH